PATTEETSVRPRDTTAPTRAQNAPTAKRIGVESPRIAAIAGPLLVAVVTRDSRQEALDLLAHPVDLLRRHVRVQRQGQGFRLAVTVCSIRSLTRCATPRSR